MHKLIIRSINNCCETDQYEIGQVEFINGYNNQSFVFSIWTDDDFESAATEDFCAIIWLNSVIPLEEFESLSEEELENNYDNHLFSLDLDDLLRDSKYVRVLLKEKFNFEIEIPKENQLFPIQSILIDETIHDITFKAKRGSLSINDIEDLKQLKEGEKDIEIGNLKYLIPYVEALLDKNAS